MAVDGISDRSERERRKPALSLSGNIGPAGAVTGPSGPHPPARSSPAQATGVHRHIAEQKGGDVRFRARAGNRAYSFRHYWSACPVVYRAYGVAAAVACLWVAEWL